MIDNGDPRERKGRGAWRRALLCRAPLRSRRLTRHRPATRLALLRPCFCSGTPRRVIMRKTVKLLCAALTLPVAIAWAEDKSGHKAMAGAGKSDAAVIAKATSAAPPDIGRNAAVVGMGADGKMKELRSGGNGWMCMLDLVGDSMCLDKEWQVWGDAWMNKKDPPKRSGLGVAYMLKGDKGASNTDPYATKATADNHWVVSGPHIMLLPPDAGQLDAYPTDWTKGGPWVMWKGTPYAHIMVPTTSTAKSAPKK
ncbi:MAG: hypothetical protein ABI809_06170 [Caldimonas sp.]